MIKIIKSPITSLNVYNITNEKHRLTEDIGFPINEKMIKAENLVKRYGSNYALSDVSFEIGLCIKKTGLKTVRGAIASGDQFIGSEAAKKRITDNFPEAVACEMEGAAIGLTCYMSKVPFAVIRAISDNANDNGHLDFPTFAKLAAKNSTDALELFVKEYGYRY